MKKISLLFVMIFSCILAFSQNAKIEGQLVDEKKEPIVQATVLVDAAKGLATVTDIDGFYELSLPPGTYDVTFKSMSKEEQVIKVTLTEGEKRTINLTLVEKPKIFNQIVVTGSKYEKKQSEETVSLEVMKSNVLANQNVTDVANGVQKIPGVTIADGQANIRGGSGWSYGAGSRVAVLYDDLLITTADADDAKWSMMPVENIEQIEVLKGAASAIYGSGALNGVINARMAYPTDKPYTKLQTYAGFYEGPTKTRSMKWWQGKPQYFVGGQFADRRKLGQFDIITGLAYNNDRGHLDSSDNQDVRVNAKIRYRFKKITGLNIGINALAYWSWGKTFFLWDSVGSKAYKPMPGTITQYDNSRYLIDPFINYTIKDVNKLSLRYRWLNSSNVNSTGQGSIAHRHIIDLSYQRPFDVSEKVKINFVAGVGGRIDKISPPANPNDTTPVALREHIIDSLGYFPTPYLYGVKPHSAYNASVYAQVDGKFFNKLNVTLGARWEYFNIDGKNSLKDLTYPLFRFGLNYEAAKATWVRASFGQGFRYPSIAELFVTTTVGPLAIYPNVNLKPEKGYSAEIGVKQGYQFGKKAVTTGYIDVAGFWNQYDNMMEFMFGGFGDPFTRPTFGAGFSSQNIGKTRILGIDASVAAQTVYKDFTFSLLVGYTFINTKSLNWNDPLTIYNENGGVIKPSDGLGLFQTTYNGSNAPAGFDTINKLTYGMTSSANKNSLKYRPNHQVKIIFTAAYKNFDFNLDYQFISFQQNIDNAFVSGLFRGVAPAFEGLYNYRNSQIAKNYAGDHIINLGVGYKPVEKLKIAFIVKNAMNWEWMPRPGRFEAPRNYTLQVGYTF